MGLSIAEYSSLSQCRNVFLRLYAQIKSLSLDSHICVVITAAFLFASGNIAADEPANTTSIQRISPETEGSPQVCETPQNGNCDAGGVGEATTGNLPESTFGNPVNIMTGSKYQREVDFELPGSMLMLRRNYNSEQVDSNMGLGLGWRHSYSVSLVDTGNGSREITQSNGSRISFSSDGTNEEGLQLMRAVQSNQGYLIQNENKYSWHLPDGRILKFTGSYLVEIDWPDQRNLSLFYKSKRLATVTDETGRQLTFSYAANGLPKFQEGRFGTSPNHIKNVTLPDGSIIEYDYNNNNLTRARYSDKTNREYHYENETYRSHLTGLTDRTGSRYASWSYDEYGRAVTSEYMNGIERVSVEFPEVSAVENGDLVQTVVTNSLGNQSMFTWQQPSLHAPAQLLSSEGPGCATCPPTGYAYTYDSDGRLLTSKKIGDGNAIGLGSILYSYDGQGRISEIRGVDAAGQDHLIERYEYEALSLWATRTFRPSVNPDSEQMFEVLRNADGLPTRIVKRGYAPWVALPNESDYEKGALTPNKYQPIESIRHFEYDGRKLISVDGPRVDVDDITILHWNEENRLTTIDRPSMGSMKLLKFDELGRPTEFKIADASSFILEYHSSGNLSAISYRGNVVKFEYDNEGRTLSYTDVNGNQTRIERDSVGRAIGNVDPFGRRTAVEWDNESRQSKLSMYGIDGTLLNSVQNVYAIDALLESTTNKSSNPHGDLSIQTTNYSYDDANQLTDVSSQETGQTMGVSTDILGRSATVFSAGKTLATFHMDKLGREIGITDSLGNKTQNHYDDFGQRVAVVSPDTGIERLERNSAGQVIKRVREDSGSTNYEYDAAGRIKVRTHSNGNTTQYDYNELNGQLISISNAVSVERFEYNNDQDLLVHSRFIDGHNFETRYQYNQHGKMTRKELPDGQVLLYQYYKQGVNQGALQSISRRNWYGGQESIVTDIDLERRDGTIGWTSHNGLKTKMQTAHGGHIVNIDTPSVQNTHYRYNDSEQIVSADKNGEKSKYSYQQGRLVHAELPGSMRAYDYDSLGNRRALYVRETASGKLKGTEYHYAEKGGGNRLLKIDDMQSGSTQTLQYSKGGAPLVNGDMHYRYDAERRPIEVKLATGQSVRYAYNGFGERVKKTVYKAGKKPVSTYFLFDRLALSATADEHGVVSNQYIYLDGHRPVAQLTEGELYAIHTDSLGSPTSMTGKRAKLVWAAKYLPFGEVDITLNTVSLSLRLPGQYADEETGTQYNYYRDYDPRTGRYLTSDPIGLAGGENTYAYAQLNPLSFRDVLGLFAVGDSLTRAQMEALNGNPVAIRDYINQNLQGFDDRENFYAWVHDTLNSPDSARQSDWFLAASQVNGPGALGAIDDRLPNALDIVEDETRDYIVSAGLGLAELNVQTFLSLYFGESIAGIDPPAPPGTCGIQLSGSALDLELVRYEQVRLGQLTNAYFDDPDDERGLDFVANDINGLINTTGMARFGALIGQGDERQRMVVEHFWPHNNFDYTNINDRILLGQSMVRLNNDEPWQCGRDCAIR